MGTKLVFAIGALGLWLSPLVNANDRGDRDDQRNDARASLVTDSKGRIVGEHFFITRGLLFGDGDLVRVNHRGLRFTIPLSASGFSIAAVPDNIGGADLPTIFFESNDCSGPALVPQSPMNSFVKLTLQPVTFLVGPLAMQIGDVVYVPGEFVDAPVAVGSFLRAVNSAPTCLPNIGGNNLSVAAPFYKAIKINFSDLGFVPPFKLE
jgi:hypothetical protein